MDAIEAATTVSSESAFFIEAEEVVRLISCLASSPEDDVNETSKLEVVGGAALARLRVIFDKYLECPTLLDPYLERIVTALSNNARTIAHDIYNAQSTESNVEEEEVEVEAKDDVEQSSELTLTAEALEAKDDDDDEDSKQNEIRNLKLYLSAIYAISKVRGSKHIQKFLSHDACDVEPILSALRLMENCKEEAGFNVQFYNWESTYILLVWLGMLSLVPFDLNTIDSSLKVSAGEDGGVEETTLISSMLSTARKHLADAGPTREAAASSLSSLLSRPDLEEAELADFVLFSNDILKGYLESQDSSGIGNGGTIFLVMGVVQTLATIFKTGSRSNLMDRHLRCVEMLWEQAILVAERAAPKQEIGQLGSGGGALLLRKLLAKLFARVGCSYLPPRVASWRYQRGRRSLLENLGSATASKESNAVPQKPLKSQKSNDIGDSSAGGPSSDIFDVPHQVEDSMAQLIHSLTDPATTVRWSAAKGIGRVTERLPAVCADDVLDAILELCDDLENDNAWHGSCLTLAELARRGLLLPRRLGEVVPIVIRAIQYDVPRGQHSVGAHVRDAACYTCWAFARAYAPSVLKPYVRDLSKAIVIASVFDREINCRRAASASFQECVGRQGADNFKDGIAILTAADYFTLGSRVDAYTSVAFYIAGFEEYRRAIIDHLFEDKLFHWDKEIRSLSSVSLRGLTKLDPVYFAETVLPYLVKYSTHENLFVRHGALIGVAEVVLALGDLAREESGGALAIPEDVMTSISNLVFVIEKARLYRGRGGEIMRSAVSRLVECMARSNVPMTVKQQVGLLDTIDANLKHPKEDIQEAAAEALYAMTRSYFPVGENGPSDRLQKRMVDTYITSVRTDENPAATRGYSLALGRLPAKLLAPNSSVLDSVIDCLSHASHRDTLIGGQGDSETRRNSIQSLVRICETVGVGTSPDMHSVYPAVALSHSQVKQVFQALLDAVNDYNTDRRGDVGSWSRIASMNGLEKVVYLTIKASNIPQNTPRNGVVSASQSPSLPSVPSLEMRFASLEPDVSNKALNCVINNKPFREDTKPTSLAMYFDDEMCSKVIGAMLKQLSEKLDAVRNQAGTCLQRILTSQDPVVPFVPSKEVLLDALTLNSNKEINWAKPETTFPLVMRAINIDVFFEEILSGMIISVGGLTESVTKYSSKSFLEYIRALKSVKASGKISKIGHGTFYVRSH